MPATAELWQLVFRDGHETSHDTPDFHREQRRQTTAPASTAAIDDAELVARIRSGDEAAFRALYLAHAAVLMGMARHILHDTASAEDAVHDVFANMWEQRARFQPSRVGAYLVGAVRRRALDRARHARVVTRTEDDAAEDVAAVMSVAPALPDHAASRAELAAALAAAVNHLSERRRTALLLRVIHGASYQEIAQVLGVGETAAHMLVTRTLTSLRPLFARFLDEG